MVVGPSKNVCGGEMFTERRDTLLAEYIYKSSYMRMNLEENLILKMYFSKAMILPVPVS